MKVALRAGRLEITPDTERERRFLRLAARRGALRHAGTVFKRAEIARRGLKARPVAWHFEPAPKEGQAR